MYNDAVPAFDVMGKKSFFLGDVGQGARMKLVVNMIMGSMLGALCEGLALADAGGLDQETLLEVLSIGALSSPLLKGKVPAMIKRDYPTSFPLKHQQKDIRLAIALGDMVSQPLPIAAATNETFKSAMAMDHGDDDFSAVYEAVAKHWKKSC